VRLRQPGEPWLIPVRLDDCDIPDFEVGPGTLLASLQRADLFGPIRDVEARRLVKAVLRILSNGLEDAQQASEFPVTDVSPTAAEWDSSRRLPAWPDDDRAFQMHTTVDIVVLAVRWGILRVLVRRRDNEPFLGHWALAGGFLRTDEDLTEAAVLELAHEPIIGPDNLLLMHLEQLAIYGAPGRDPRGRVLSIAYVGVAPRLPYQPASDARQAAWIDVDQAYGKLAFDHDQTLVDAVE
jgi:ADP-ribose pyrophosphatase YjhB (NUDIX family)